MSGRVYNNQQFKDHINANYYPLQNMIKSVAILKSSELIDIETLEYGQYQPILSPRDKWPSGSGKLWQREMGKARLDLATQPNSAALSKDQPGVVPLTKCALLDASVRKCFNSEPPIPMQIDVKEQDKTAPNADRHDILLTWEHKNGDDQPPTLLLLTMVCPA
ncbi:MULTISPECIES: hypothetical protein [Bradyrhizobium]|jgi:hypothetical protein|uniref:hypothetical protein n=1 Tax=Bradyrhizobium TaxID=374 RepID=UPI0004138746|nr:MULTISPECIES: hypothetical protein [Bradyrhizobium]AUC98500.1 hypothetical protein CWS35_32830 [Bradyrhizobium sp. SK17]KIU43896.1 hypothetical protein QU41_29830 [Bradyrhizobium elkanii]MBK5652151.1 hypothetical protein [Rhizobium sp.]OCX27597.1 hypothetical protein QU42_26835 [Bradyrhizobium sp. UASWS1016]